MTDGTLTFRNAALAFGLLGIAALLLYFFNVVLLVFAGILLAVLFRSCGRLLERGLHIRKKISLLITLSLLVVLFGALLLFSLPEIVKQGGDFVDRLPEAIDRLKKVLSSLGLERFVADFQSPGKYLSERPRLFSTITGFFSITFGFAANLALILLIGIFLAADPDLYTNGLIRLFPPAARPKAAAVVEDIEKILRWWLLGRLIAMAFIGLLVSAGLWAIGIPLALFLGLIAGLFNFIPYIGPVLSVIPALLFAIPQGMQALALVILLYLLVQAVENSILTPIIQQKAVDLPPVYGIAFQLVLGISAGGFGIALASPLAAVSILLVRELYVKRIEGESKPQGE